MGGLFLFFSLSLFLYLTVAKPRWIALSSLVFPVGQLGIRPGAAREWTLRKWPRFAIASAKGTGIVAQREDDFLSSVLSRLPGGVERSIGFLGSCCFIDFLFSQEKTLRSSTWTRSEARAPASPGVCLSSCRESFQLQPQPLQLSARMIYLDPWLD